MFKSFVHRFFCLIIAITFLNKVEGTAFEQSMYASENSEIAKLSNGARRADNKILKFNNYEEVQTAEFPISDNYTFVGVGETSIFQGWKLHICAKQTSMEKILKIVAPMLKIYEVSFKYATFSGLELLDANSTQRGKFITIYPSSLLHANEIAHAIDATLKSAIEQGIINPLTDFETIKNDARLGETGGLFTRYGAYKKGLCNFVKPHAFLTQADALDCTDSSIIPDSRSCPLPDFALDWEENPFPGFAMTWEEISLWE